MPSKTPRPAPIHGRLFFLVDSSFLLFLDFTSIFPATFFRLANA